LTAGRVPARKGTAALGVDGCPVSRALGVYMLSRHNIEAEAAENGHTALSMIADRHYDLIFIMDYFLPELDEIQEAAQARGRALTISMSAGAESAGDIGAGQGHLAKPVDQLKLNLLLREMLPRLPGPTAELPVQIDAPDPVDNRLDDLIRDLSEVAGLNVEQGLANACYSVEVYVGMLQRFTAELVDYIGPLLNLSADGDREDREETAARLNVLWEFFSSIGAEDLALTGAQLAAADAGGGQAYISRVRSYCDDMLCLRAKLASLKDWNSRDGRAERREPERRGAGRVDLAALRRHISGLRDACLACRAEEAQTLADGLRSLAWPGDLEEQMAAICALIDDFDYHKAHELCAGLLEAIKPEAWGNRI
jgi:CheY-like chemotaxis protein